jgi:hypothetical protein
MMARTSQNLFAIYNSPKNIFSHSLFHKELQVSHVWLGFCFRKFWQPYLQADSHKRFISVVKNKHLYRITNHLLAIFGTMGGNGFMHQLTLLSQKLPPKPTG